MFVVSSTVCRSLPGLLSLEQWQDSVCTRRSIKILKVRCRTCLASVVRDAFFEARCPYGFLSSLCRWFPLGICACSSVVTMWVSLCTTLLIDVCSAIVARAQQDFW